MTPQYTARLKTVLRRVMDAQGVRREERLFQVFTSRYDISAKGAEALPVYGDAHPDAELNLVVTDVDYSQVSGAAGRFWDCVVVYERSVEVGDIVLESVRGRPSEDTRELVTDMSDDGSEWAMQPVVNATGRRFAETKTVGTKAWIMEIVRKETTEPELHLLAYNNTINDDIVDLPGGFTIPPRRARMQVSWEWTHEESHPYRYTYRIEARFTPFKDPKWSIPDSRLAVFSAQGAEVDSGWCVPILEQGYTYIVYDDPESEEPEAIGRDVFVDDPDDGEEDRDSAEPGLLQGWYKDGVENTTPGAPAEPGEYYWTSWLPAQQKSWSGLALTTGWNELLGE